jgi:hypothetical protein
MSNTLSIVAADPLANFTPEKLNELDVDKLAKVMEVRERWESRVAEQMLAASLAEFQRSCPSIKKERKSNNGNYASLDDIMFAIREALAANGLSVSFDTGVPGEGILSVKCHVLHAGGATFSREVTVPVDKQMRVNDTQKMGSAISYAKRYALIAALNLIVSDHDDDGNAAGSQFVTREQVAILEDLIRKCPEGTLDSLLKWAKCDSLSDIDANKFKKAESTLKTRVQ